MPAVNVVVINSVVSFFLLFTVCPIRCMSLRITQVQCNILVHDTCMHVTTICYIQMRMSERVLMSSRCILVLIIFH